MKRNKYLNLYNPRLLLPQPRAEGPSADTKCSQLAYREQAERYYVNFVISMKIIGCSFWLSVLVRQTCIKTRHLGPFFCPLFGIRSCPLLGDCLSIVCLVNSIRATGFVCCRGLSASQSVRFGRHHCIYPSL